MDIVLSLYPRARIRAGVARPPAVESIIAVRWDSAPDVRGEVADTYLLHIVQRHVNLIPEPENRRRLVPRPPEKHSMALPYDEGYAACPCFWGREPSSLVRELRTLVPSFGGYHVLDAGCGEGKNAVYFAEQGASVRAIDFSPLALQNARAAWGSPEKVEWELGDIRRIEFEAGAYDIVVAYGVLHCLADEMEVRASVLKLQSATKAGGFNLVCSFNSRAQDLRAHPGFSPVLLAHRDYEHLYSSWKTLLSSDSDLSEVHPHNAIEHTHSMTRLLMLKI
jgi:2-polyprenyl-3-methyl-5-hydroxy-6-metoxy-1,4-benzoquinol methylase